MKPDPDSIQKKRRETILSLTMTIVIGAVFVFFLNLVSLGIFAYVIAIIVGIMLIGFIHYAIWGYALSQDVADQRAREAQKDLWEDERRDLDDRIQRY